MKKILPLLLLVGAVSSAKAQSPGVFSYVDVSNVYTNIIKSGIWTANFRSGLIQETNGSINFGMNGYKSSLFRFRWLAHDNGAIDYSVDTDELMSLGNTGTLIVKEGLVVDDITSPNTAALTIKGPNDYQISNRDINFQFAAAGTATIRSRRGTAWDTYLQFMTSPIGNTGGTPSVRMQIDGDGNVAIGTTDPKGYKLAVAGNMIAEKVKIKLAANWPDYVFDSTYALPSLQDVRSHIKNNRTLPGVPSAETISREGIDVGEMQKLQMQKIEELTLYMISLKEENDKLKTRVAELEKQNKH